MTLGPSTRWRFVLAAAVVGFLYLGLSPNRTQPPVWYVDVVAHALLNFAIGLVIYKAFATGRAFWLALLALAVFGGVVEMLQAWSPTRAPEISDGLANLVGVIAAGVVAVWATRRWRRRS
jgi:VanZ family protein